MIRFAKIGLVLVFALQAAGCTVAMVVWASTDVGTGEVLGERQGLDGHREVVYRLEGGEFRVIRVPDGWCGDPVRVREVAGGTLVEREALLASHRIDAPRAEEKPKYAPVCSLDYRATLRATLKTRPNEKEPVDHTAASSDGPPSYLAVVRFLDEEGHLLHVLFGYDPKRFRWVRLSEPVDLGIPSRRMGWGAALFPLCLAVDSATLAADFAVGIFTGGVTGVFTAVSYMAGTGLFRIAPSDHVAPIPRPEVLRPVRRPD